MDVEDKANKKNRPVRKSSPQLNVPLRRAY